MLSWIKRHWGWISAISILIIVSAFFFHSWLDAIVSLDYARQEAEYQRKEIGVLQSLLLETGKRMNRSELKHLVVERVGKSYVKEEGDQLLLVGDVVLEFSGDSLVKVKSLNE
jgi:hypothetical protein